MTNIIEKAKDRATHLTQQAKEKVGDLKETRRAESLYNELGRIAFRQHTARTGVGDSARAASIVAELTALEVEQPSPAHTAPTPPPPPAPG